MPLYRSVFFSYMIKTSDLNELLENALEELKRADHLVFVSLKYTRTVDVIRSVIERLISTLDCITILLLEDAKRKGMIKDYPNAQALRIDLSMKLFSYEPQILLALNIFTLLRKLNKAEYTKMEEYRRHVRMIVSLDYGDTLEIKIDTVTEYYEKILDFVRFVRSRIFEKKDE